MTTQLMTELDSLLEIVEARLPANPNSIKNLKLANQLERELAKYFKSLEQAFSYSRLESLYNKHVKESLGSDTEDMLDPLLAALTDSLTHGVNGHVATIYISGSAEMISWAGLPYEGPPIQQAIEWAEKHCAELVKGMNEESKRQLAKIISDGIKNKRGIPGLARDIRKSFSDMSRYRSRMIARTETNNALSKAFMDRAKDMGIEGREVVRGSDYDCDICGENAGAGCVPLNQAFPSGHTEPAFHPNCLLPENEALPLGLIAMTRAYYSGQAIEMKTRSGNKLTVTPNHPILTPFGFISADKLNEGDYIISCPDSKRVISAINPDYDYIPAAIEEIWESLTLSSSVSKGSMEVSPIDFHGDARFFYGNVNIINSNRFLMGGVNNSPIPEHISEKELSFGGSKAFPFSCFSSLFEFSNRNLSTPDSFMGSGGTSLLLHRRQFAHHKKVSLACIPRLNTSFQEPIPNAVAVNTIPFTKGQLGFSRQIPIDNISIGDYTVKSILAGDTIPFQNTIEGCFAYTELANQFIGGFTRLITVDELIGVKRFYYSGHVYNLQSIEQLYIANNIVVKNCACALAPCRLSR